MLRKQNSDLFKKRPIKFAFNFPKLVLIGILTSGMALTLVAATPLLVDDKNGAVEVELRSISDYRKDLKAFMKHSKDEDNIQLQQAAIYNLCQLHTMIVTDPRFNDSQQLQGIRMVVLKRLKDWSKEFKLKEIRAARKAKKALAKSEDKSKRKGNTNLKSNSAGEPSSSYASSSVDDVQQTEQSNIDAETFSAASNSYDAMGSFSGGPAQMFNFVGGRFAPPWDHGEELVELIENTINPAFWRNNGGTGAIHYFRPLQVLVIGASAQMQDETRELLIKLRRASGTQINSGLQYGTGNN